MPSLSNIQKSYGQQFNMAVANTNGDTLLGAKGLPANTVIVSSPSDENGDIGTYALFATDWEGTPVRLTYTMHPGNGLIQDGDTLHMGIDDRTLSISDNKVTIPIESLIDNSTITYTEKGITVSTQNLRHASKDANGVFMIDDSTVKSINSTIYVDTDNLMRANEYNKGVVITDMSTMHIQDGRVSVVTKNLAHDSMSHGVSMPDGITIKSDNGIYSVSTENLSFSTKERYGMSMPDNKTILSNAGIYSAVTDKMSEATHDRYGVVSVNPASIDIHDGVISVKNYRNMLSTTKSFAERTEYVNSIIDKTNDLLDNYAIMTGTPTIFDFSCNGVTSAVLTKSKPGTSPDRIASETVSAEFNVNTNCPFYISVMYEDNVAPGICLYQIDYDRVDIYPGNLGLNNIFQSTNGQDKTIQFSFMCKNYAVGDPHEYSRHTRIHISINYTKDITVSDYIDFDIVRFNTLYNIDNASDIFDKYLRLEYERLNIINTTFLTVNDEDVPDNNTIYLICNNTDTTDTTHSATEQYYEYEELDTINSNCTFSMYTDKFNTVDSLFYSAYSVVENSGLQGAYMHNSVLTHYLSDNDDITVTAETYDDALNKEKKITINYIGNDYIVI